MQNRITRLIVNIAVGIAIVMCKIFGFELR
jgi:hypothetical protein